MAEADPAVDLVFLWHHHQPDYRSPRDGRSLLPWVRLHASKDYLDMALRLRRHPGIHSAFNFVPSLLDQLEDVARGRGDALFELLAREVGGLNESDRLELIARCTVAPRHAFERWPAYRRLTERAHRARQSGGRTENFGDGELLALEVWFLLAWIDPMFLDAPEAVAALASQTRFTTPVRDGLLVLHRRLVSEVIPAYRSLAETGQIELSESPYYHPILPLLVNVEAARRARPELTLPTESFAAPDDAVLQVQRAVARHERTFGARPAGMWPSEGSVSPEAAEIMARAGLRWAATDEAVLWGSLAPGERRREVLYRPWRVETAAGPLALLFRDHELSDRIGFVYHHWQSQDAVADFISRVRKIARDHGGQGVPPVVSVILDGENCWEHYPEDGGPFLNALYEALEAAPDIHTRTPSEILAARETLPVLERLHSGSWINGDFRIWIGHPEKNRAWDLISRARKALVAEHKTPESHPEAWEALYVAEGSDWFWWFGDDHYTHDKALFDRLFREHLQAVYERAGLPVPGWLQVPVATVRARRDARITPLGLLRPVLDGRRTNFYEWDGAAHYRLGAGGGSMHRASGLGSDLHFGFDLQQLYVRIDFVSEALPLPQHDLTIDILAPQQVRARVVGLEPGPRRVEWIDGARPGEKIDGAACCIDRILELGIPFAVLGVTAGQSVEILIHVVHQGQVIETLPADDLLRFRVPDESFESAMWSA